MRLCPRQGCGSSRPLEAGQGGPLSLKAWARQTTREAWADPVVPHVWSGRFSLLMAFYLPKCGKEEREWTSTGPTCWYQALMADGNDQGTSWGARKPPSSLGSFWLAGCRWLQVGGASPSAGRGGRGSSATASVWEVSVLGVCLPACLPLCCSEGGRGWACSCLGRAAPAWDTASPSG